MNFSFGVENVNAMQCWLSQIIRIVRVVKLFFPESRERSFNGVCFAVVVVVVVVVLHHTQED